MVGWWMFSQTHNCLHVLNGGIYRVSTHVYVFVPDLGDMSQYLYVIHLINPLQQTISLMTNNKPT